MRIRSVVYKAAPMLASRVVLGLPGFGHHGASRLWRLCDAPNPFSAKCFSAGKRPSTPNERAERPARKTGQGIPSAVSRVTQRETVARPIWSLGSQEWTHVRRHVLPKLARPSVGIRALPQTQVRNLSQFPVSVVWRRAKLDS
jgi:hypothetical protein